MRNAFSAVHEAVTDSRSGGHSERPGKGASVAGTPLSGSSCAECPAICGLCKSTMTPTNCAMKGRGTTSNHGLQSVYSWVYCSSG